MAHLNEPVEILDYDETAFPFRELVREHLNVYDLSRLHELVHADGVFQRENDQSTWAHRRFYEIGEPVVFQRIPTFRVHLPGNVAVGEFHRDTEYHHLPAAVNFWLPLTPTSGNNSVWIEQDGDMAAPSLGPGQVLAFDGVGLYHGNKLNDTSHTRVSFDVRIVPESKFVPSEEGSVNTGVKMVIGGYYATLAATPTGT